MLASLERLCGILLRHLCEALFAQIGQSCAVKLVGVYLSGWYGEHQHAVSGCRLQHFPVFLPGHDESGSIPCHGQWGGVLLHLDAVAAPCGNGGLHFIQLADNVVGFPAVTTMTFRHFTGCPHQSVLHKFLKENVGAPVIVNFHAKTACTFAQVQYAPIRLRAIVKGCKHVILNRHCEFSVKFVALARNGFRACIFLKQPSEQIGYLRLRRY